MAKEDLLKGFVLGVVATALLPAARRALGDRGESLARAAVRLGGVLGDKALEVATEIGEIAEDTLAELQDAKAVDKPEAGSGSEAAAAEEVQQTGTG